MGGFLMTVGNLLPYHLLSYGALLGTEVYQVSGQHMRRIKHLYLISWILENTHSDALLARALSTPNFVFRPSQCASF